MEDDELQAIRARRLAELQGKSQQVKKKERKKENRESFGIAND